MTNPPSVSVTAGEELIADLLLAHAELIAHPENETNAYRYHARLSALTARCATLEAEKDELERALEQERDALRSSPPSPDPRER